MNGMKHTVLSVAAQHQRAFRAALSHLVSTLRDFDNGEHLVPIPWRGFAFTELPRDLYLRAIDQLSMVAYRWPEPPRPPYESASENAMKLLHVWMSRHASKCLFEDASTAPDQLFHVYAEATTASFVLGIGYRENVAGA